MLGWFSIDATLSAVVSRLRRALGDDGANGLIQTEHVMPRKELRHKSLDVMFDDSLELFLRGLARAKA